MLSTLGATSIIPRKFASPASLLTPQTRSPGRIRQGPKVRAKRRVTFSASSSSRTKLKFARRQKRHEPKRMNREGHEVYSCGKKTREKALQRLRFALRKMLCEQRRRHDISRSPFNSPVPPPPATENSLPDSHSHRASHPDSIPRAQVFADAPASDRTTLAR